MTWELLFDRFAPLGRGRPEPRGAWVPAVDIEEDPREYRLLVELPDVDKKDVKVAVQDGVLTITGERNRVVEKNEGTTVHRIERHTGQFGRSFTLPENVDPGGIRAEAKDGMLTLHLQKREPVDPKMVQVKVQ